MDRPALRLLGDRGWPHDLFHVEAVLAPAGGEDDQLLLVLRRRQDRQLSTEAAGRGAVSWVDLMEASLVPEGEA